MTGCFFHRLQIQRFRQAIDESAVKNCRFVRIPDPVAVGFCFAVQSCMESLRCLLAGVYADILRQIPPQLRQNLIAGQFALAMEICHLVLCMGPGIGPAAAGNLDLLPQDPGKGLLQLTLYGIVLPLQPLPAPVPGAVVADIKPQIPHSPPAPLVLPVRCRQRTGNYPCDHIPESVRGHYE